MTRLSGYAGGSQQKGILLIVNPSPGQHDLRIIPAQIFYKPTIDDFAHNALRTNLSEVERPSHDNSRMPLKSRGFVLGNDRERSGHKRGFDQTSGHRHQIIGIIPQSYHNVGIDDSTGYDQLCKSKQ